MLSGIRSLGLKQLLSGLTVRAEPREADLTFTGDSAWFCIACPRAFLYAFSLTAEKQLLNPQPYMVREGMRGEDQQQNHMINYLSPGARARKDHSLRAIRAMVDEVLTQLSRWPR
jgi:hypothetical protein